MSITAKIIKKLMQVESLSEAELARRAGMTQTTLHRILSGETSSPRVKSLQPIAHYFDRTVSSLLEETELVEITKQENGTECSSVPILEWRKELLLNPAGLISKKYTVTKTKISKQSFAVILQDCSMGLIFPKGTTLIIDPLKKLTDRCHVLVFIPNQKEDIIFRQYIEGQDKKPYLKTIGLDLNEITMIPVPKKSQVIGVLVEAVTRYE